MSRCRVVVCSSPVHCKEIGHCFADESAAAADSAVSKLPVHTQAVIRLLLAHGEGAAKDYVETTVSPKIAEARREFYRLAHEQVVLNRIIAAACKVTFGKEK